VKGRNLYRLPLEPAGQLIGDGLVERDEEGPESGGYVLDRLLDCRRFSRSGDGVDDRVARTVGDVFEDSELIRAPGTQGGISFSRG
jgi:hypothetical protein